MKEYLLKLYNELDISSEYDMERLEFATRHVNAMQLARESGRVQSTLEDALKMLKYYNTVRRKQSTYMHQRLVQFVCGTVREELRCLNSL